MPDKTMATLAVALQSAGIEVVDHYDSKERADTVHSSVVFYGDDTAGKRAVGIAWQRGYEPQGLVRDWAIIGQEFCEPHWMMLFD